MRSILVANAPHPPSEALPGLPELHRWASRRSNANIQLLLSSYASDMPLPLSDAVIAAVSQLVDDAKGEGYREPSHADIDFYAGRAKLGRHDPKAQGQTVGKAKRVRAMLHGAFDDGDAAGGVFAESLLAKVKACGGFREGSPNFVGLQAIQNARDAFDAEGISMGSDGSVAPKVLASLTGVELTTALMAYARRAQKGAQDAALLAGTGKDLLEATAAHVLVSVNGRYPQDANLPSLLGMAFIALDLAVPEIPPAPGEAPIKALERGLFASALGVNRLRNREGSGHGRPWLTTLTDAEAKAAVEVVGCVAAYMLSKLSSRRR